jgi:beta-phosphoglucomutase
MTDLKTILFDFDGVVIDSEPLHAKAKKMVLDRFNLSYPRTIFDDYKGKPDKVFFDYVSNTLDKKRQNTDFYQNAKKLIFEEIIDELKLIEGFFPFHEKVKESGLRTALVSSTSLYSLAVVDKKYNVSGMFDLVITEADTDLHKPYPDPYLKALEKLPASTESSVVIEDSPNGIVSAKKAGLFVFALTSSFKKQILLEAGADEVFENYYELSQKIKF